MKFAILVFPGTNCERDLFHAIVNVLGYEAEYVQHSNRDPTALDHFDAVLLPGGASFGDKPRPGAKAAETGIIPALNRANDVGKPILGICNGFQILTEAGLLPGLLLPNPNGLFMCKTVPVKVTRSDTIFTKAYATGQVVRYPIAHVTGNYVCSERALQDLYDNKQVLFTYEDNPNGSIGNIAGICNKVGNVLGLMPHPERAVEAILGGADGLGLFESMIQKTM